MAKLSIYVKISMQTSRRGCFKNKKGSGTSFQTTLSLDFFNKKFYLAILHEVTKFQ